MTYLELNGRKLKPYEYMTFLDDPTDGAEPQAEPVEEISNSEEIPLV